MTAKEHNRLVGIFLMAHGGVQALVFVILSVVYGVMGVAMFATARGDEKFVGLIFVGMVVLLIVVGLIFVLPQVLGGYKLLKERPGARTWGIVGSIISCFSFPLGTAAGVYGLWFLFGEAGLQFYLCQTERPMFQNPPQPPQPNSWQ